MQGLNCPVCAAPNLATARFCEECGSAVDSTTGQAAPGRSWVVGSLPGCDLVVDHPSVSGRHCQLEEREGGDFLLQDLGSTNGTFVNGCRVASSKVTSADRVTLGKSVPMPWPEARRRALPPVGAHRIAIGRDADNDVVLDFPMISGRHARITIAGGQAVLEDLSSTNGTAIGAPDRKITSSPLALSDTVYFGSFPIPAARLLGGAVSLGKGPHSTLRFTGATLVLGRASDCDVVLDVPTVSWHHARLRREGGRVLVEDLGSTNGTFLNGRRLEGTAAVQIGDSIGLGSHSFTLTGPQTIEQRDFRGNVAIEARELSVDIAGKRLIAEIALTIYPSELVGLMGPSGAGKSVLMSALNGYRRPSVGKVLFNNQDLFASYGQFRLHIGYVPQDDIMHRDLTVRQALYYTARLRLPSDMSDAQISARIERLLDQLELSGTEDVLIGSPEKRRGISGGQRKRVNFAMELLTEPFVLFLDEPTSGLSSEDALMVMKLLRGLADEGKTILITIHQPSREVFQLMDDALLLAKDRNSPLPARMSYFGPAYPDAITFFDSQAPEADLSPDRILRAMKQRPTEEWVAKYAASAYRQHYVEDRMGNHPTAGGAEPGTAPRGGGGLHQWWTLVRRNFVIKLRDSWNTAILLAQAPIIAALIVLVFRAAIAAPRDLGGGSPAMGVLFLTVVAALWFGCSNSAREVVAEWPIFQRERMINLSLPAYVGSKFAVLGGLCLIQCGLLLGIIYHPCRLHGDPLRMLAILLLAALIGVALGLLISALARSSEVAIALVPLVLLPMVILGGMMLPLHMMEKAVQWLAALMPSRWAFEGLSLVDNAGRPTEIMTGLFPLGVRSTLAAVLAVMVGMLLALVCGIGAALRSRDVH
jgi:ABC-type multidrug transport system ATPase subunit/pSer/pThr/pTyr-binding forkhead associated (FHA) protein